MNINYDLVLNTGIQHFELFINDSELEKLYFNLSNDELIKKLQNLSGDWQRHPDLLYVRYRISYENDEFKFLFAIDTTSGNPLKGFICNDEINIAPKNVNIYLPVENISDENLEGFINELTYPTLFLIEIVKISHSDKPIPVTLVLDIGNSRTCGLLTEERDSQAPLSVKEAIPLKYFSQLTLFDNKYECIFGSNIEFIPPIWQDRGECKDYTIRELDSKFDIFMRFVCYWPIFNIRVNKTPLKTFKNDAHVALGNSAKQWRKGTEYQEPLSTGLSSPKRYLWSSKAHHSSWSYATKKKFQLRILDRACLSNIINRSVPKLKEYLDIFCCTKEDKFPKRELMIFFIYEILRVAYQQINSWEYRDTKGMKGRARYISDVVITFPSIMSKNEVFAFKQIVDFASVCFSKNYYAQVLEVNKEQINCHMDWDEGFCSMLFFVESMLESNGGEINKTVQKINDIPNRNDWTIASIDIGGGTIDMAVARFSPDPNVVRKINCEVLSIDGDCIGGDNLLHKIIEKIIIPQMISAIGGDSNRKVEKLKNFFRIELPSEKKKHRVAIMHEVFIPIALWMINQEQELSELETEIDLEKIMQIGGYQTHIRNLPVDKDEAEKILSMKIKLNLTELNTFIREIFENPIKNLLKSIDHNIDNVILAGRISELCTIKKIVQENINKNIKILDFHEPAVKKNLNKIFGNHSIDPKISVSTGALVAWISNRGKSATGNVFQINNSSVAKSYIWGLIDIGSMEIFKTLFNSSKSNDSMEISIAEGEHYIGCQRGQYSELKATLRYKLTLKTETTITFRKKYDPLVKEELIYIDSKDVRLEPQSYIENDNFWIDSGDLDYV